ncbi:MAG: hypothetical protein Q9212_007485, partial [Teloschistes hypoglaucus]
MRGEYSTLYTDIPADIPWATESLGDSAGPDAVNLWIGNSRSVTALHKDNYENIYAQIRGEKCFVLLPPVETPCVNVKYLEQATYACSGEDQIHIKVAIYELSPKTTLQQAFTLTPEPSSDKIPWATWDPDKPDTNATALSHLSRPLRVDLAPGDLLYLPAL